MGGIWSGREVGGGASQKGDRESWEEGGYTQFRVCLGLRRGCRSQEAGLEILRCSIPLSLREPLPQGAVSCQPAAAGASGSVSAIQPWPGTSWATPSSGTAAPISRLSLPWSFPLGGRGPLQAELLSEALPSPSLHRCQAGLAI